jgi:DNA end-binding protein Ku
MAQRALWTGTITFGLVSIPIKLYSATESKSVSFNQIHAKCKTKIQERRWCPKCERYVDWDEIEKGFEYDKGKYISVTKDDLESIPLLSKNTIAVQSFIKISEIDPIYFEKSYYVQPDEKSSRPFSLLIETLIDKKMVGIGIFTIRTKERLCCVRPVGGVVIIDTLLYPDEIKVDLKAKLPETKLNAQERKMASSLVDMMAQPFNPENFKDHYREALEKVIDEKLEGIALDDARKLTREKSTNSTDLMESLRRSLRVIEGGKSTKSTEDKSRQKRTDSKKSSQSDKTHLKSVKSFDRGRKGKSTVSKRRQSHAKAG